MNEEKNTMADEPRVVADSVYAQLKERFENDPLSLDLLDKVLLLASASVSYLTRHEQYEALLSDLASTVETRLRLAGKLAELFEKGTYQGESILADIHQLLPEDTDRTLLKVGLVDLAQRVARLIGKVALLDRERRNAEVPDDAWPFSKEKLQAEREILIAKGMSPDDPDFERLAMKRAGLKIMMGPGRFEQMERDDAGD